MTYDEFLQYYSNLLITEYRGQPKAQATIQALARQALIDNLPLSIQNAFNLDSAIGVQLDTLGKYAGVERNVLTFTGGQSLNDSEFRTLIYLALSVNSCKGSLYDIDLLLTQFFGNSLIAFDNANMSMGYFFNASFGSLALAEAFVELDLLPRPMGVALASLIYAVGLDNVFGFGSYQAPPFEVSGFTSYFDASTVATTGTLVSGSAGVSSVPSTAAFSADDAIAGIGIPLETFIDTVDSSTHLTLTELATASGTGVALYIQEPAPWLNYSNIVII